MNDMTKIQELLVILMEECGEVIQASSKVLRFGEESNMKELQKEIGDLYAMLTLMEENGLITWEACEARQERKFEKLKVYSKLFEEK